MLDAQSLNRMWDEFSGEQISLHNKLKNTDKDNNDLNKELSLVNSILTNLIKLRNLRNKKID
jgi:hypothetical protein